jgi:predicted transporter
MQGREIFGALVRILGIWFLIQASVEIITLVLRLSHVLVDTPSQMSIEKIFAGLYLLLAFLLLAAADKIVNLLYGPRST